MTTIRKWLFALCAGLAFGACSNAGEANVLAIEDTGVVNGLVFFDRNGNHILDGADTSLVNLSVRLISRGGRDTVARGTSSTTGGFRFSAVPIGSYTLFVDTTKVLGDSFRVTVLDTSAITLRPNDTARIQIGVSFPQLTVAQGRAAPVGKKMFLAGVALDTRGTFGDTTVNLADTTAAIRMTAVRTTTVALGDSIRVFGTRATRDGQPSLNQVTAYTLAIEATPPLTVVTTTKAASADGGVLDAALVKVVQALVTDTVTVQGNRRLTVSDNSGPLEVALDTLAGFRSGALAGDTIGATLDIAGILVPAGGIWRLKPRSPSDLVAHGP